MDIEAADSTTWHHSSPRKRAPKACRRCRHQKIRCTGLHPCEPCAKRQLSCHFDDHAQKILVTRGYIRDLERRVASLQRQSEPSSSRDPPTASDEHPSLNVTTLELEAADRVDHHENNNADSNRNGGTHQLPGVSSRLLPPGSRNSEDSGGSIPSSPGLQNPLALGFPSYFPDTSGRPIYLGTSSNWSFGRKVLAMAHEKVLGAPLPPENLLFEGKSYDLEWDGERRPARNSSSQAAEVSPALPSADFATFLINAVKFHCGQVFYLFEDERFTQQFSQFQRDPTKTMEASRLWYIHYLLVLAFGKAFVAPPTNGRSRKPPGAELFVHAMTLMPEFSFYDADPIEEIQVLCCAALYLQCLDFRGAAYCMIGRALRKALEHGMHTKIHGRTKIDGGLVQRRRKVWWTVYVLDRQMSALMGVPLGVADEAISAELPTFVDQPQKSTAMDIQIQLSRVLALALNTVYGPALGINKRFVENTREALKALAKTTDQLNSSFGIFENGAITTISRISGYLHLLYHQCVVLITRPLLYSFLRSRLGQSIHQSLIATLQSSSVRSLLQMCVESAQQILTILLALQSHSLLESFLPFDLDATFTSGISLLIAATVDPSLVDHSHPQWLQRTHAVLDEMVSRGNRVAGMIKLELSQLQDILGRLPPLDKDGRNLRRDPRATTGRQGDHPMQDANRVMTANVGATQSSRQIPADATSSPPCMMNPPAESSVSDEFVTEYINWQEGFPAEQLINFAESMDLSALDWLSAET